MSEYDRRKKNSFLLIADFREKGFLKWKTACLLLWRKGGFLCGVLLLEGLPPVADEASETSEEAFNCPPAPSRDEADGAEDEKPHVTPYPVEGNEVD